MLFKFEGDCSKEVARYNFRSQQVTIIILCVLFAVAVPLIFLIISPLASIIAFVVCLIIAVGSYCLELFLSRRPQKCILTITKYDFTLERALEVTLVIPYFQLTKIEDHDTFFVFFLARYGKFAFDKTNLVVGSLEDFNNCFQKEIVAPGEQPLETDDEEVPFEPETPEGEFYTATIRDKWIANDVTRSLDFLLAQSGFPRMVSFLLEDGTEVSYKVSEECFDKLNLGDKGTLVVVNDTFFDFEIEE